MPQGPQGPEHVLLSGKPLVGSSGPDASFVLFLGS